MHYLKTFFSPQYLFHFNSAHIDPSEKLFFLAGVVLVLLAIVLKISAVLAPSPIDSKYRHKFYTLFLSIGISEIIWYLFRYENVSFFSTPFVSWLIVLVGIIWLVSLVVSIIRNYKREDQTWQKEQVKLRYLPK